MSILSLFSLAFHMDTWELCEELYLFSGTVRDGRLWHQLQDFSAGNVRFKWVISMIFLLFAGNHAQSGFYRAT